MIEYPIVRGPELTHGYQRYGIFTGITWQKSEILYVIKGGMVFQILGDHWYVIFARS